MSTQKLQVGRALPVIPSNFACVPFPALTAAGTATAAAGSQFSDSTKNFITLQVGAGDIVYNTTTGAAGTVVSVLNATTLVLNTNAVAIGNAYSLYLGENNAGCVLYVGSAGSIRVTTAGGDDVTFAGVLAGQFIPVNVTKVWATGTGATSIIALW